MKIATVAFLVRDYEEAASWLEEKLGFIRVADAPLGEGKRWLAVAPPGGAGVSLLLAKAASPAQAAAVGDQSGGRVFLFLETDDFARDHQAMTAKGVRFLESPRAEPYGEVAVFEDLYGNRWDLIERR